MWELSPRVLSGCILTSKCHHMYLSTQNYHFLFISDSEHTCTKYEHESIIEVWKYVPKYSRQSQRQLTMTNTFREHLLRAIREYYCIIQKTCEHWDTHYSMTFENNNLNIHCHPSIKSEMGQHSQFLWWFVLLILQCIEWWWKWKRILIMQYFGTKTEWIYIIVWLCVLPWPSRHWPYGRNSD